MIAPRGYIEDIVAPACGHDPRVMEAFLKTPRHRFVEEALQRQAYADLALPIGFGQTISRPSTVAMMTRALETESFHRVLEVGTGSGFQAAILSHLVDQVFTVERIPELYRMTSTRLSGLKLRNIVMKRDDGTLGWSIKGPFDRILVACEAARFPEQLSNQLAEGGVMILPIGGNLMKYRKVDDTLHAERLSDCSFVDFVMKG